MSRSGGLTPERAAISLQPLVGGSAVASAFAANPFFSNSAPASLPLSAPSRPVPASPLPTEVETFLQNQSRTEEFKDVELDYTLVLGAPMPWTRPNIDHKRNIGQQLSKMLPKASTDTDWWVAG